MSPLTILNKHTHIYSEYVCMYVFITATMSYCGHDASVTDNSKKIT